MDASARLRIHRIGPGELALMRGMLALFAEVFADAESYLGHPPTDEYLERLLRLDSFVPLVALEGDRVIGALAAYELPKFEQARSEFHIYDLAVAATHRRRGVATALIREVQSIAAARGGWVVFVQADTGEEDKPAIALYSKLGRKEEVLHFDLPVLGRQR